MCIRDRGCTGSGYRIGAFNLDSGYKPPKIRAARFNDHWGPTRADSFRWDSVWIGRGDADKLRGSVRSDAGAAAGGGHGGRGCESSGDVHGDRRIVRSRRRLVTEQFRTAAPLELTQRGGDEPFGCVTSDNE